MTTPAQPGRPARPGAHRPGGAGTPASPPRQPGRDEITVAPVRGRSLCYARGHRALGKLADVMVTFGELGTGPGDALWQEVWGASVPMCTNCWAITCTVATARRPRLAVRDLRPPAQPGGRDPGPGPG
jgi:hypothetical protein